MNTELNDLLVARELRDNFELKLLKKYNQVLITVKANYAGSNKNTIEAHLIAYHFFLITKKLFHITHIAHTLSTEGLIFFLITPEDAKTVKQKLVEIEAGSDIGRLIDLDVRTLAQNYSRSDFNLPKRKCFICNKPAVICVRNRTHTVTDVLNFTNKMVYKNIIKIDSSVSELLGKIVEVSLLEELCRMYGFGCVTVNTNGSHNDMNFLFMLNCFPVLISAIAGLNCSNTKDFNSLRNYGKTFENKLFKLTNGVNTYKGALFLLLILNACVLNCNNFDSLQNRIAEFSKPVLNDFITDNCSTVSLNSFKTMNQAGIRGLALGGFKNHFNTYLPLLENNTNPNNIILKMISETFDTTTIKRGGIESLIQLQTFAKEATTIEKIKQLDNFCIKNNLSTGGTADNLILLYDLYLIKKFYY